MKYEEIKWVNEIDPDGLGVFFTLHEIAKIPIEFLERRQREFDEKRKLSKSDT